MDSNKKINVSIAGSGTVTPGDYGVVSAAGSCSIVGDITCEVLKASGSASASGKIRCSENIKTAGSFRSSSDIETAELHASGAFYCEGNVKAESMSMSGSSKIMGNTESKKIKASGSFYTHGNLRSETAEFAGSCVIDGDCECEEFTGYSVKIGGLLNAGRASIYLSDAKSSIGSIGCEKLTVKPENGIILSKLSILFHRSGELKTSNIEADEVDIVNVKADKISCINAKIGSGCDIARIEYSGEINVDPSAHVGELIKM